MTQNLLIDGYEVVIGIEIHCQLNTATKIFSPASTEFGQEPNTQANIIDLAMPGVLPVLNAEVVEKAVKFGLGVNAQIGQMNAFDRKNYFYPDLPKGYQTSQMAHPIVGQGYIDILVNAGAKNEYTKRIGITRAHLEEDAGKSVHDAVPQMTGVDLNRAGTPLIEIVSEPDIRSADEAVAYVKTIHELVTWLGISDAIMAEGSFRADINVSVHKPNTPFGTRCELKNLNSFRFIERAIKSEIERQIDLIEDGGKVVQATRLYDPEKDETRAMRTKEEANDYRYFPCPDLLPVMISDETLQAIKDKMPELPEPRRKRFVEYYGLPKYDSHILTQSREMADYFEDVVKIITDTHAKTVSNWIMSELMGLFNKYTLSSFSPKIVQDIELSMILEKVLSKEIGSKDAKGILNELFLERIASHDNLFYEKEVVGDTAIHTQKYNMRYTVDIDNELKSPAYKIKYRQDGENQVLDITATIQENNLQQQNDSSVIEAIIKEVLANNQAMVDEYKGGKEKAFNGLVGQVMKASKGKANPAQVNELLKKLIG